MADNPVTRNVYVVIDYCGPNPLLGHGSLDILGTYRQEEDAWAAIEKSVDAFINQNDNDIYTRLFGEISEPVIKIDSGSKWVQVVNKIKLGCSAAINRHHFYRIVSVTLS